MFVLPKLIKKLTSDSNLNTVDLIGKFVLENNILQKILGDDSE